MNFDISSLELLCLALSVGTYAGGATLWMYFTAPPREFDVLATQHAGGNYFGDTAEKAGT